MRQELERALKAIESACKRIDELKAENKTLKEALVQPEQEPVAYINIEKRRLEWAYDYMSWDTPTVVNLPRIPLYTTPQQRTWVGLTEEEKKNIFLKWYGKHWAYTSQLQSVMDSVETKLKDKNHGNS